MTLRTIAAAAAAGLILSAGMAGLAAAQETMPAPIEEPAPMQIDITEEKLQRFALAYLEVNQIGQIYEAQLQGAASDDERMAIQQQAQMEMGEAVEQLDGLTIDEYNGIFTLAQSDPALAQQIEGHINALVQQQ